MICHGIEMDKKQILIALLFCIIFFSCSSKEEIKISYQIKQDSVIQKSYNAVVISPYKIKSNYKDGFNSKTSAIIEFKFSINGFDNEARQGFNHSLYIPPTSNYYVTPVYKFGEYADEMQNIKNNEEFLPDNSFINVVFRADFSKILNSFRNKGYYITPTGNKLDKEEFNGFFIAGSVEPLSWNFGEIQKNEEYKFTDTNGDGIYECSILIKTNNYRAVDNEGFAIWEKKSDISKYPKYSTNYNILEAIYNMSLEELLYSVRDDSTFMAGAKWHGVWTRDISYSIYLSLALVEPEIAKRSLLAKVRRDRIIQDTGTGGSWPISTDRVVWASAAWEIYLITGDRDWLNKIYTILKNTLEADFKNAFDKNTGLMFGESSFLDWREQSYPIWMDPKDIYFSKCLGTNALHYRALEVMSEICNELEIDSSKYSKRADELKKAINNYLWNSEKGYYGQYLYGRSFNILSPKSETLGESLSILFNIADHEKAMSIISNMPVTEFGPTCFYPQIPNIPPYHNNAIWPFVSSYFTWAAGQTDNLEAIEFGINSLIRSAALFLTNKENMVATTGHFEGTEINSNRMLWSISGNLAIAYRVLFGINLRSDGIEFNPKVPDKFGVRHQLESFKYRNAEISVIIDGSGSKIKKVLINGKESEKAFIKADSKGKYQIEIFLNNERSDNKVNLVKNSFSPETPVVVLDGDSLIWNSNPNIKEHKIIVNGKVITKQTLNRYNCSNQNDYSEISIVAVDSAGYESFMSEPIAIYKNENFIKPNDKNTDNQYSGYTDGGYIKSTKLVNNKIKFEVNVQDSGDYVIDFRYANGNGPINTNNVCAIRSLFLNKKFICSVVFPQRGEKKWDDWGYSNPVVIKVDKGNHEVILKYDSINENMNINKNEALIDGLRIIKLNNN